LEDLLKRSFNILSEPVPEHVDLRKLSLSLLRSGHHHVDLSAAAAGTDQPLAPIENGGFGAVPSSHLGRIRLNLMLAFLAPHDQPDLGRGGNPSVIGGPR
jgi:hypothetical protein